MDQYLGQGLIEEEVIAQIGNSDYIPENYEYFKFLDKNSFDALIERADLIITHSGVGSIITAINSSKPVIVFPRLAQYQEHVDNHQLDIANAFSKKQYVLCCQEEDKLIDVIQKSKTYLFERYQSQTEKIIKAVRSYIEEVL